MRSISDCVAGAFSRRDIRLLTGIGGVERIDKGGRASPALLYARGRRPVLLDAEAVVLAVGWPGNVDALNPAAAQIETEHSYMAGSMTPCVPAHRISSPRGISQGG